MRRRDVRGLFRERTFSASAVLLTVGILVMAGSQLFTLQYLQLVNVVGLAVAIALAVLAATLIAAIAALGNAH